MLWLRQSTAVTISFGPFVLNTDGVTLVTNLTGTGSNQTENTSTGIRLSKNGGAFAARHATAGTSSYDAFGNYLVPLDTTDTNTLGGLRIQFADGAHFCPVFMDAMVINSALWDALFASSGGAIPNVAAGASGGLPLGVDASGRVDVLKINGTSQTARDIGASVLLSSGSGAGQLDFTSGIVKANLAQILGTALTETAGQIAAAFKKFFNIATPAATMDHGVLVDTVTTYTGNTQQTGDSYALANGANGFAAIKGDTAAIKAETDNLPAAPAAASDCITAAGVRTAVGMASANLDTQLAEIEGETDDIAAIKTKTDQLAFTVANQVDANALSGGGGGGGLDAAGVRSAIGLASANLDTQLSGVQSDTNDIQARLPAALTGAGNMKADVLALNGDATAAQVSGILNGANVVYQGTVTGAATTTTLTDSGLTQSSTDWWKGRIIIFTSVIPLQATDITGFDPATDKLTFTATTAAPTGATYVII